eukprot:6192747-Pleurochrysis_carterae.AAC.2
MRPKLASSCVIAPKLLPAGSLFARSPMPAAYTAAVILSHDSSPPVLERCREVAFVGSRSSVKQASAATTASSMHGFVVSLFASSYGKKSSACMQACELVLAHRGRASELHRFVRRENVVGVLGERQQLALELGKNARCMRLVEQQLAIFSDRLLHRLQKDVERAPHRTHAPIELDQLVRVAGEPAKRQHHSQMDD